VLAEATKLKPDIIVLDVDMPLLNGLDAGKRTSTGNDDSQEITG
jgi:YesN/AraC family two-component response regulator